MGQVLLSAYLSSVNPETAPEKIIACVKDEEAAKELAVTYAGKTGNIAFQSSYGRKSNSDAIKNSQVVIVATKPHVLGEILQELKEDVSDLDQKLYISVAAGWTLGQLSSATGSGHISRVMTNISAKYQCSAAVISYTNEITKEERALISDFISPIGTIIELPESNMDAATGLVGSGPAFMLTVLEGLIESGVSLGIPYEESRKCALKVMEGTAKMVQARNTSPGELKREICTPGGTTIAGLVEMESKGVKYGVIRAVQKAAERASELGQTR